MNGTGPLSAADRDAISYTADSIALLPIPGCSDLAHLLTCIAATQRPSLAQLNEVTDLARRVRRALIVETSPDQWIEDTRGLGEHERAGLVDDLIAQRYQQAEQVAHVVALLERLVVRREPATA